MQALEDLSAWARRSRNALVGGVVVVSFLLAAALWFQWSSYALSLATLRHQSQELQAKLRSLSKPHQASAPLVSQVTVERPTLDPVDWPIRTDAVESWVRNAAAISAKNHDVFLQQLSITWPLETSAVEQPVPFTLLKVTARGSYGALKAWQMSMQQRLFHAGVESLRWQAPPNDGSGQLTADWTWRVWVRNTSDARPEKLSVELELPPPPLRSELKISAKDPFGFPPPPPPPKPVVKVVEPVPVAVPVIALPPPVQWNTIGRLRGPDGRQRVTGHWGNESDIVTLGEGDLTPSGHKVLRITATVMELQHPETKEQLSFRLPVPPRFETR